jgi:hypothetical protein
MKVVLIAPDDPTPAAAASKPVKLNDLRLLDSGKLSVKRHG